MNRFAKTSVISIFAVIVALLLPLSAKAQGQIITKKVKISDFTQKTTKMVLSGNAFFVGALEDEVASRWRISPFEFCTLEEFESLKTNDNYYFLMTTSGQFKKENEPGIDFLTLVKGGEKASEGIESMLEVVSIPIAASEDPSGREINVLAAYLNIIQNYTLEAMESDINAYGGLATDTGRLSKSKDKKIIFAEEDLEKGVDQSLISASFNGNVEIMDADSADEVIADNTSGVLVSYTIAPSTPGNGSYCYKILIDPYEHQLYYYRKHRISKKYGVGFLPEDIKRIASARK